MSIREVVPSLAKQYPTLPANARHFEEWRNRATTLASIAAVEWRTTNLTGAGDPANVVIVRASGTVFDVLETPVALGRPLTRADERPDHPPVAVISQRLWEDRLGRDPQVLGRSLILGGTQYTIVGVLAPGSELPAFDLLSESASLSSTFAAVVPFRLNLANVGWMGQFNYPVIARSNPRVALEQARAELDVIQESVAKSRRRRPTSRRAARLIMPLEESIVGRARLGPPAAPRRDRRRCADRLREPREPVARAGAGSNAGRRGSKRARRQPRAAGPRDRARTASARGSRRSAGTAGRARRAEPVRQDGAHRSPPRQRYRDR